MRGIHRVVPGRLFEATDMSQPYFTPPGAYNADSRIDISSFGDAPDRVFGAGVEYPIGMVRCAIVWDDSTQTFAMMLGIRFKSYYRRWSELEIWTHAARMELQHSRYGKPGTVTWFAKFRKDEEYLDGKFPKAQVYSQTELKEMRKA